MKMLNNRNFGPYFGARQCSSVANDPSLPLTQLARGICIAIVAACIVLVPQAGAVSFTGVSSGTFVNPTGAAGMVSTGVGTSTFTWGTGYGSPPSSLIFTPTSFAGVLPEQTFWLGNLSYFNGTVLGGTEAYSVDLRSKLAFTSPIGLTQNFDFDFSLINTPNTASATESADSMYLSSFLPTTIFTVGGIDYTLKMWFGAVVGGGYSEIDEFTVFEGSWAHANLLGVITGINPPPPSVPDTGSTLALMAMALVGVGGLRQYLTCKA